MITEIATNNSLYTTFVYIFPQKEKQTGLWNEILAMKPVNDEHWLLMGDFNNIISFNEKSGGNQSVTNHMINFTVFLNKMFVL